MNFIALKMLLGDRTKYAGLLFGIAFTSFLVTFATSYFGGMMTRSFELIAENPKADVWVMDPAVVAVARQHDVRWLDELVFEPGAFYVMDRGYMDFKRLNKIGGAGAFFVTRAKDNLRFSRQHSLSVDYSTGVRSDQIGKPTLAKARAAFPALLRKVRYFDAETERHLVFLTNHLEIPSPTVALIYRLRWRIELFFRWIKGHLRIKHYYGTSPNAVKTQIWIAMTVYLMIAIIHKQSSLPGTLHRTLQLLSVHPFEKAPLHELFTETEFKAIPAENSNQLLLLNL